MKVAVLGSTGQLGSDLVPQFESEGHEIVAFTHADIDITDATRVAEAIRSSAVDAVVNCAAYTRVDDAEGDADAAFSVNAVGALNVARACREIDALCVYISTDYVFGGDTLEPNTERDVPEPINVYGVSKLAGEQLVRQTCSDALIVRVASLFGGAGASGNGSNFIEAILGRAKAGDPVRVVGDTQITPTYTQDAADAIVPLVYQRVGGIFHVTNSVSIPCTWHALARKAVELCGLDVIVDSISSDEYPTVAQRPVNSALDNKKVADQLGKSMPAWEDALIRYLREKRHIS